MRIVLQFDPTNDCLISFSDTSNNVALQRPFLPSPSLVGKTFYSLIPAEEHEKLRETLKSLGPTMPVAMATHDFQEDPLRTEKITMKTVFCWVFQPTVAATGDNGHCNGLGGGGGAAAKLRPMVQSVSQMFFIGFQNTHSKDLVNMALRNVPDLIFKLSKDLIYLDYFAKVSLSHYHVVLFVFVS
jgi:hypothetical protein